MFSLRKRFARWWLLKLTWFPTPCTQYKTGGQGKSKTCCMCKQGNHICGLAKEMLHTEPRQHRCRRCYKYSCNQLPLPSHAPEAPPENCPHCKMCHHHPKNALSVPQLQLSQECILASSQTQLRLTQHHAAGIAEQKSQTGSSANTHRAKMTYLAGP